MNKAEIADTVRRRFADLAKEKRVFGKIVATGGNISSTLANYGATIDQFGDGKPEYYATKDFFAFASFAEIAAWKTAREDYNRRRETPIEVFRSENDLIDYLAKAIQ